MYLSTIADDTTLRKLHSKVEATALANNVLPVPFRGESVSNQVKGKVPGGP